MATKILLATPALPQKNLSFQNNLIYPGAFDSLEALKIANQTRTQIFSVSLTGILWQEYAVQVIKRAADDYILLLRLGFYCPVINNTLHQ
ncbi:MAG: hypothetical protein M3R50_06340 [Bacteroidota bacterium]|nr:hypothetical protein [Bacteroidota bacterium]